MSATQYAVVVTLKIVWEQPKSPGAPDGHRWTRPVELDASFEAQKYINRMLEVAGYSMSGVMDVIDVKIDPEDPRNVVVTGTRSNGCHHPEAKFKQDVLDNYATSSDGWMEGDISIAVPFAPKHDAEVFVEFVSFKKLPKGKRVGKLSSTFKNKNVVLAGVRDERLESWLGKNHATLQANVTKVTDFLIVKDVNESSGKHTKANKYGVTIISIDDIPY